MAANRLSWSLLRSTTLSTTSRKEGKKGVTPRNPSLPLAVERVVKRSKDRVSQL
jgi:hypothetical protein